ncbi:carbohydrate ABC transporter membrane protein 1, CUT1 family [Microbacterium testaceum StLB037]|uniref:Carbohydrate ABC transporter membrane protein 1, CUT1 family n=1 Tax=Microbacterium testaceum (strain StLB037) TaxID=979556 RepID=A0A1H0QIB2_MICTS|nr:carbohydrate ABC transporter membrane protein 1, CUT1 family [Microbacterium testaceum StLB037]
MTVAIVGNVPYTLNCTDQTEIDIVVDTSARAATRPRRGRRGPHLWAVLFLLPSLIAIVSFDYWPLLRTGFLSMQSTNLFGQPNGFVGSDNFAAMFSDPDFWRTLGITVLFMLGSVAGKVIVGLAIALPVSQRVRGTGVFRASVLIPMAVSTAVAGLAFRALMTPSTGLFDVIARALGGDNVGWLTSTNVSLLSVIIVDVWTAIGFTVLLLLAALDSIDKQVFEAADVDGARFWRRTFSITLPLITPTLFFVVVTQSIQALREFTIINVLTAGGPADSTRTLVIDIYQAAFGGTADYGASSARSIILLVLILALTAIQFGVLERRVNYR